MTAVLTLIEKRMSHNNDRGKHTGKKKCSLFCIIFVVFVTNMLQNKTTETKWTADRPVCAERGAVLTLKIRSFCKKKKKRQKKKKTLLNYFSTFMRSLLLTNVEGWKTKALGCPLEVWAAWSDKSIKIDAEGFITPGSRDVNVEFVIFFFFFFEEL